MILTKYTTYIVALSCLVVLGLMHDVRGSFAFLPSTAQSDIGALKSLYDDTNGPHWSWHTPITNISAIWNFSAPTVNPCGGWQGVFCEAVSATEGRVAGLILDNYNITGTIPAGLQSLSFLNNLGLGSNHLHGTIPSFLCAMRNLSYLDLGINQLTGAFPACFLQNESSNILSLYLGINLLHGVLPNVTTQKNISILNFQSNFFSGRIPPSWKHLPLLQTFFVANNLLSGPIEILSHMKHMRYLGLSQNIFTGTLPASLGELEELRDVYLHENYFWGSIPCAWSNFTDLYYFSMYENSLTGTLCTGFSRWEHAEVITVDDNYLTGTLPPEFSKMRELQQLTVYFNIFSGTVPSEYSQLTKLQLFLVQENALHGNLDGVFNSTLQKYLQTVDVSMNAFTGRLPSEVFTDALLSFSAFQTCFDGSIPEDVCNARSLETLVLDGVTSYCAKNIWPGVPDSPQYSHPVKRGAPECIWQLPNITTLHLSSNDLSGTIPNLPSYGNLTNLDLSFNRFVGTIPMTLQNWTPLMSLNLKNNRLVGEISGMSQLHYTRSASEPGISLSLSNNRLSGIIPLEILHALYIDIVDGNLFTCSSHHQPPYSDPNSANYVCASNMLDISLFCFMSAGLLLLLCIVLGVIIVHRQYQAYAASPDVEASASDRAPLHAVEQPRDGVGLTALWAIYQRSNDTVYLSERWEQLAPRKDEATAFNWQTRTQRQLTRMTLSLLFWRRIVVETREAPDDRYLRRHAFLTQFLRSVKVLRQITLYLCLFVVLVTVPLYDFMKQHYGTYTSQFRWLISGAFFSGYEPAVAVLLLWFLTLVLTVYLIDRDIPPLVTEGGSPGGKAADSSLADALAGRTNHFWANFRFNSSDTFQSSASRASSSLASASQESFAEGDKVAPLPPPRSSSDTGSSTSTNKQSRSALRQTIFQATQTLTETVKTSADYWRRPSVWISIVALFLNIVVVVAIKAGFIYLLISSQTTFSFKVLIEMGLATVDLTWSAILVPVIVNRLPRKRATGRMLLKTCMLYFNSIFAPCVVIAVVDTSCFNGLFVKASQVEEQFHIRYCYLLNQNDPQQCASYKSFTTTRYYTPLFIYNYDCYSTIVTNYIPIFLISYTTLTLFVPLVSAIVMTRDRPWTLFQALPAVYKADSVHCADPWLSSAASVAPAAAAKAPSIAEVVSRLHDPPPVAHRFADSDVSGAPVSIASASPPPQLAPRVDSTASSDGWTRYSSRAASTATPVDDAAKGGEAVAAAPRPLPFRSRSVFFPAFILASAIHHLLVLITFGLLCPALAVSVAVVVASTTLTWEIVIGRWMTRGAVSRDLSQCAQLDEARLQQLDAVCENVCTSPRKSIWILCFGSAFFFAFVLLDMAGDQQGWHGALWAPITTTLAATCLWLWYAALADSPLTVTLQQRRANAYAAFATAGTMAAAEASHAPAAHVGGSSGGSGGSSFVDSDFPANYYDRHPDSFGGAPATSPWDHPSVDEQRFHAGRFLSAGRFFSTASTAAAPPLAGAAPGAAPPAGATIELLTQPSPSAATQP